MSESGMIKKQRGMTAIGWLIVIALVATQAMMALRIIPIYINDGSIKSVLEALPNDPEVRGKPARDVRYFIDRRLQINGITDFERDKKAFKFRKTTSGLEVKLHYEKRGPIFSNLEFVATFDHSVVIPKS